MYTTYDALEKFWKINETEKTTVNKDCSPAMWKEQKFNVTEEPFLLVGLAVLEAQEFHPVPVEMRHKQTLWLKGNWCQKVKDLFLLMDTQIKIV